MVCEIPRLKRVADSNASRESDWADFTSYQVRRTSIPRRKQVAGQSVDLESASSSEAGVTPRSHIHMSKSMNAMTESQFVDVDLLRKQRFLTQNVHGHVSDSSVQRLLYAVVPEKDLDGSCIETGELCSLSVFFVSPFRVFRITACKFKHLVFLRSSFSVSIHLFRWRSWLQFLCTSYSVMRLMQVIVKTFWHNCQASQKSSFPLNNKPVCAVTTYEPHIWFNKLL